MSMKLKPSGETLPKDFETFSGAFAHFLATWYEKPDNAMDTLEIRHAFYAGAIYLKSLVGRAQKKLPGEARETVARVFKELVDEAARNAAAPWPENFRNPAPAAAPAPAAEPELLTGPPEANPQPMMWTIGMVQEFEAGFRGAEAAGAPTFPFKGHTFRTADAPAILNHLRQVFAGDQPQPPQPRPQ